MLVAKIESIVSYYYSYIMKTKTDILKSEEAF